MTALFFAAPARAQEGAGAAAELQSMCRADAAQLWGVTLCGPLLVVDPATHAAWTSVPDGQGLFTIGQGGWVGVLPDGVAIANTSLDWGGTRWIVLLSPLPEDPAARRVLLAHEAWHRVQSEIGFPALEGANAHLATERGRTLMRLELRALATALRSRGRGQLRAAEDALVLRAARHAAFPTARAEETALDRNEGLAAYTGVRLGADEPLQFALRTLDQADHEEAFAGAYANASGPAYGLLLDFHRSGWRTGLGGGAPADLLAAAIRAGAADRRAVAEASARYGGAQVGAEEEARARALPGPE